MTADEVADLLQVGRAWVYEQARLNRIPHVRLGRYVRFEREEIDRWLETQRRGPGSEPRRQAR